LVLHQISFAGMCTVLVAANTRSPNEREAMAKSRFAGQATAAHSRVRESANPTSGSTSVTSSAWSNSSIRTTSKKARGAPARVSRSRSGTAFPQPGTALRAAMWSQPQPLRPAAQPRRPALARCRGRRATRRCRRRDNPAGAPSRSRSSGPRPAGRRRPSAG